ncbi:glycosyl hydrolase family 71-domain-containing protein [Lasiosphaeria hispida]|uniref:Glycosyl hydrolase family 71-domain-containing protein n=1 Tax=Lasiosphaeria hispida TaxID=260671 RepID=A0AAJ0MA86_9PEZI|nr:glycosyl hydrolase family 71-domain-containing protein [Lasiosphaeria hispida]
MIPNNVFAHYMVGLCINQTAEHWFDDISSAGASATDGFALNIGAGDDFTLDALRRAYDAASKLDNFTLFLSFDFNAAGNWTVDSISNLTNTFKGEPAQFKVDGKPMVSTFEGVPFAKNWTDVRKKVKGGIFFVPDWTSLRPGGIGKKVDYVDGQAGRQLGYDRWEQVLDVDPDMVEIITWNDFGESHYIGDIREEQVIDSAKPYVDGLTHEGFRAILPYYAAAYKAGTIGQARQATLAMGDGVAIAWYRPTPANITGCGDGGTKWGQEGNLTAKAGVADVINIIAVSRKDTPLIISMGGQTRTIDLLAGPPNFIQVPFSDFANERGNVTITMNRVTSSGPAITDECPKSSVLNFNSAAIYAKAPRTPDDTGHSNSSSGSGSGTSGSQPKSAAPAGVKTSLAVAALAAVCVVFFQL